MEVLQTMTANRSPNSSNQIYKIRSCTKVSSYVEYVSVGWPHPLGCMYAPCFCICTPRDLFLTIFVSVHHIDAIIQLGETDKLPKKK